MFKYRKIEKKQRHKILSQKKSEKNRNANVGVQKIEKKQKTTYYFYSIFMKNRENIEKNRKKQEKQKKIRPENI